jgi:hypothetical protein
MSKQKNIKVNVKPKHVIDGKWFYKGIYQKHLSSKELNTIANNRIIRLKTINAPKHTERTLQRKRDKRNEKMASNKR